MSNTHTAYIDVDGQAMELSLPGVDGHDRQSIADELEHQIGEIPGVKEVEVILAP